MQKKITLFLLLFAIVFSGLSVARAQPGIISTIAGNSTQGFYGDGGPAIHAEFDGPAGITKDTAGNLYIADYVNDRVRKVTYATGVITTIAGTGDSAGTSGAFSGDGGPATAADLYNPTSIALDVSGNVFFSDQGNHRVRKINVSTGIITTIAGNGTGGYSGDGIQATASELFYPAGIAFDTAGNLYIADWQNHRIRMVTLSTGIITTVAGTGIAGYSGDGGPATAARFYRPSELAFDVSGNLYISEYGNSTVRKVVKATGIITTIAGTGVAGYSGDGSAATAAQLNQPLVVRTDTAGNIYIADWRNYVVRMVSAATGIISTIAGDNVNSYSGDGGPATNAGLSSIDGMAIDVSGNVYIADEFNNVIREIECPTCIGVGVPVTNNTHAQSIYPNPATNWLTIQSADQPINLVAITSLVGQIVFAHAYNTTLVKINITGLAQGIYLVKINGTEVKKFVKE